MQGNAIRASRLVQVPCVTKDWAEEDPQRGVKWAELFLDLVFGVVLSNLGMLLRGSYGVFLSFEVFARVFLTIWFVWMVRKRVRAGGVVSAPVRLVLQVSR